MAEDIVDLDMLRCSLCYKYPNKRKCFSCAVADEIERLRSEVAAWRDLDKERLRTIRQSIDFILSQDAEIERLRAVAEFAAHSDGCEQPWHGIKRVCTCGLMELWEARRD